MLGNQLQLIAGCCPSSFQNILFYIILKREREQKLTPL